MCIKRASTPYTIHVSMVFHNDWLTSNSRETGARASFARDACLRFATCFLLKLMLVLAIGMRDEKGYPIPLEVMSRQAMFECEPALATNGNWICVGVSPRTAWPVKPQSVSFAGHLIWIVPTTLEAHAGLALNAPPELHRDDAEAILYRLLSLISWREEIALTVADRSGGNLPRMMGLNNGNSSPPREAFDFIELEWPEEDDARLALAFMREGRGINHFGYAFLSFWRVLEVAFPNSRARVDWMAAVLPNLDGHGVAETLAALAAQGIADVGRHLFESGRCAIAHANGQPIINPDDPRDARRLMNELPLVKELAVRAMDDRFGIQTRSKIYREHLYELRGWKAKFGEAIVGGFLQDTIPDEIDLPRINFRLKDTPPYAPFEGMEPVDATFADGRLNLTYARPGRLVELRFTLSFEDERLVFDVANGIFGRDDGSVMAAEYRRDIECFMRDYFLNGAARIWDAETGTLLTRLAPYIPLNCYLDLDNANLAIDEATAEIGRRRGA